MNVQDKFLNRPTPDSHCLAIGGSSGLSHPNGFMFFDAKGDHSISEGLQFLTRGQLPFGEWMKKLGAQDRPPRGRCSKFFSANQKLRRSI
jgi:hypothetical protein